MAGNVSARWVSGNLVFYDASQNIIATIDGTNRKITLPVGSVLTQQQAINLAAASQTLTAAQSGQRFVGAVDAVFTLPAASSTTKGVWYEFECGALSTGTGLSISPAASDHIRGNGLTAVDDKDLINSGATDRLGDSVRLYCDGVDGWVIAAIIGTWAKE